MPVDSPLPRKKARRRFGLSNGDRLTTDEFLRRWNAEPELKKVELIGGTVYMASPIRADVHSEPDGLLHLWLAYYAAQHAALKFYPNPTLIIDRENAPQPDSVLCYTRAAGGGAWVNRKGYLCGAPELVCEVAASSVSMDMHSKHDLYRRSGVKEYMVWLTLEDRVCWFVLEDEKYIELSGRSGLLKSRIFPGLVLDVKALLRMDGAKVLGTLQRHLNR